MKTYHGEEYDANTQTFDVHDINSQEILDSDQQMIGYKRSASDSTITSIFNITTERQRSELLCNTIPGWVETSSIWEFNSEKARKGHKSIFEMLVLDLLPWSTVNNPGFPRHHAQMIYNFELASENITEICSTRHIIKYSRN